MDKTTDGYVRQDIEGKIATLTFYHPAHNSLPGHLLKKLTGAINTLSKNKDINVIVLKSGGDRTFCAGASFDELVSIKNKQQGKEFFSGFANVINACRKSPKIIIGRIQGKAVGGGVGIISAVDYAIASKYAGVRLSELELGIGPFVIGPAVERKIGKNAFAHMAISPGEWKSATWALDNGFYNEIHENNEEVDKAVAQKAEEVASYNPAALYTLKKVLWEGAENWDKLLAHRAEMSGELVLSDYTRKAINAIKHKS